MRDYVTVMRSFWRALPMLLKYQLITKVIQGLLLFPAFGFIFNQLLAWRGMPSLTDANVREFLWSAPGIIFMIIGAVVVTIAFILEIGGLICLSALAIHGKGEPSYLAVLKYNVRLIPKLIGPGLPFLFLILLIVLPLAQNAPNLSFLGQLRIPNFITSVIEADNRLFLAYAAVLMLCNVVAFSLIFMFHGIVLGPLRPGKATALSWAIMRRKGLALFGFELLINIVVGLVIAVVVLGVGLIFLGFVTLLRQASWAGQLVGVVGLIVVNIMVVVISVLAAPFQLHILTDRFYRYTRHLSQRDTTRYLARYADAIPSIKEKTTRSVLDHVLARRRTLVLGATILVLAASVVIASTMKTYLTPPDVIAVGHRGGAGDEAVENSLDAIGYAIDQGAPYVEIDIQRSKDDAYIIFHDDTFARLAGVKQSPADMTLAEIQQLDLGATSGGKFRDVPVPTLAETLTLTKGKTGLFLELKGRTADRRMVDDVVTMVRRYDMSERVVLMSLNYDLVRYIDQKYPEMTSGYVYVAAAGKPERLAGDWLIVEEDAAKARTLDRLRAAGKKTAVWTVNTSESMDKFTHRYADAVITDRLPQWKDQVDRRAKEAPLSSLLYLIFEDT